MTTYKVKFEDWIKNILVIVDTREKQIEHITKVFDKLNIDYKFKALKAGDYTFVYRPVNLLSRIIIERKSGLDELSQNFTKYRDRFKKEFEKTKDDNMHMIIEDNSLNDIYKGHYRSDIHCNSFLASLLSFQFKYNLKIHFIESKYVAMHILRLFYYYFYYNQEA